MDGEVAMGECGWRSVNGEVWRGECGCGIADGGV